MSSVEIKNNKIPQVKDEADAKVLKALEEIGLMGEGYAKLLCPVDTGNLRNSLTHQVIVDEKRVYIGTNVEYGKYVELGTAKMAKRPYLEPAVKGHMEEYKAIAMWSML